MSLIFVDCEAFGPCPSMGRLTEVGAVEYKTSQTFHGILWKAAPDTNNPAQSRLDPNAIQKSEEERIQVFVDFDKWLSQFSGRPIFVSDNPAYDFQWINDSFWRYLNKNPFGHSARRISDFYAGLCGDFYNTQKWKRFRVTPHDHNPVHDSIGNVEAFRTIMSGKL